MVIAFISFFAAMIIWYSRGNGWISSAIAAIPISAITDELVFVFVYFSYKRSLYSEPDFSFGRILSYTILMLLSTILLIIIPKGKKHRLRTCLITIVVCPVFYFVLMAMDTYITALACKDIIEQ